MATCHTFHDIVSAHYTACNKAHHSLRHNNVVTFLPAAQRAQHPCEHMSLLSASTGLYAWRQAARAQGGGGNTFLDIQDNFRFEEKGQQPTNSMGINMLENPMHSPHLFQISWPTSRFGSKRFPVRDRVTRFWWKARRWGKEQF